jgi:phosphoribosylamine--glycine ligase
MVEGNQCLYYIKEPVEKDIANGIVPKVDNWKSKIGWADVIVFEDTGYGHEADKLRKQGKKVFGGSAYTDKLEKDRTFGMEQAESVGIKIPFHQVFKTLDECNKFIKQNPARWVVKTNSDDKNLSFVGKQPDGVDVVDFLEFFKTRKGGKDSTGKKPEFTLQKAIDGVEIGCTATFDGAKMSVTKNLNFEHKKLLAGGYGQNTGETGTVLFNTSEHHKIFAATLDRIAPLVLKSGYRGVLDIETIVNDEGVWFIEFTSRFGHPQILITDELLEMEWSQYIYDTAAGNLLDWESNSKFACGVVLYAEGFPHWELYIERGKDQRITGITGETLQHFHLGEIKREDNVFLTAGCCGFIGVATGSADTISESRAMAMSYASKIDFENLGLRNDIGLNNKRDLTRLIQMGVINPRVTY